MKTSIFTSTISRLSTIFPTLLYRLALSWLLAVTAEYLLLPAPCRSLEDISLLTRMSALRVFSVTFFLFLLFSVLSRKYVSGRLGIVLSFLFLAALSWRGSDSSVFLAACAALFLPLFVFCKKGWNGLPEKQEHLCHNSKTAFRMTCLFCALFFLFVTLWTVSRIYCFHTPTFDFGIFAQMFHYMQTTGIPFTTLERDGLLSHLQVHISPIYYLLLPFYCLAPFPAALQILQAAVMTSAVIPLWKLGKRHGLTGWQRMFFCLLLFLYPAFAGGAGYDLHENCFLTPLLFWLFYGIDQRHAGLTAAAALLVLLVKEDAPVYVASIALWLLISSLLHRRFWGMTAGSLLLAASLTYFWAATGYLSRSGDGVMLFRYANFLPPSSASFSSILKTLLVWPMKVLFECGDREKLWFLFLTMAPLLGLPLLTRRWERYLLLFPLVLVNLMPDYTYQHDIFFQYVFGSAACLLYLAMVNLADLQDGRLRQIILTAAVVTSAVCFGAVIVPKAISYPVRYICNHSHYQTLADTLAQIPPDASVTASTFYTTLLSQRDILYDLNHTSEAHLLETEYIVFDPSDDGIFQSYATAEQSGLEGFCRWLEENGYWRSGEGNGIMIYRSMINSTSELLLQRFFCKSCVLCQLQNHDQCTRPNQNTSHQ